MANTFPSHKIVQVSIPKWEDHYEQYKTEYQQNFQTAEWKQVESMEQRVTRLMAKTEYPYELVCIPVPDLQVGPYPDKTCNAQYNGTFQVLMRIYSGEPPTLSNMLYQQVTLLKLDQMSDNELEYQLWQMALDCTHALHTSPYYKAYIK